MTELLGKGSFFEERERQRRTSDPASDPATTSPTTTEFLVVETVTVFEPAPAPFVTIAEPIAVAPEPVFVAAEPGVAPAAEPGLAAEAPAPLPPGEAAVTERVLPAAPIPIAGTRAIAAPFQFAVTGEDNLRVESWNSATGVVIGIHGRWLGRDGKVHAFRHLHTPNTDRSRRTTDYPLGHGFILNLTVFAEAGTPIPGQTFVSLKLIRGFGGATTVLGTMLQGHVSSQQHLAWPGSPIIDSLAGAGVLRTIIGTDPAAGVDPVETVPTGAIWELFSVYLTLVTDANVATRWPRVQIMAPTAAQTWSVHHTSTPASTTRIYTWCQGVSGGGVGVTIVNAASLPTRLSLRAGRTINIFTENLQAGDNWDAPVLTVHEWLEGT